MVSADGDRDMLDPGPEPSAGADPNQGSCMAGFFGVESGQDLRDASGKGAIVLSLLTLLRCRITLRGNPQGFIVNRVSSSVVSSKS